MIYSKKSARPGILALLSDKDTEPVVEVGNRCSSPYECDFCDYCWKGIPEHSIYDLPYLKEDVVNQIKRWGILKIKDVPADIPLVGRAENYVQVAKTGKPIIKAEAIKDFLETLKYPLYYLDFETINPAISLYDGLSLYQLSTIND